jgi:purine nucleoside phosphorylase
MFAISFASTPTKLNHFASFNQEVIDLLRNNLNEKAVIVIDRAWGYSSSEKLLVKDHLNLTGDNPLLGPNHSSGPRFFKTTDLYLNEGMSLPQVVTAGLKNGIQPDSQEVSALKDVGADCWSYNLVPTSLVAAHAGKRVIGLLISEDSNDDLISPEIISLLKGNLA